MEEHLEEETEKSRICWELVKSAWKRALVIISVLLAFIFYYGTKLSNGLLVFLLALLSILVALVGSMIFSAINEIKAKNEQTTPSISRLFENLPGDVFLENHEEIIDIENLNGDYNLTLKQKLVSPSENNIKEWLFFYASPDLKENPTNLKAYRINDNGNAVRDNPLKVESIRKGKDSQLFLIDFVPPKTSKIAFMIELSLNRIFRAMRTDGEWVTYTFPRQVKKYKMEIKLPKVIQKIERLCITKKSIGGDVFESGCYSVNNGVPEQIQETCFPHSQLIKEISIAQDAGRYKIVLDSKTGLNKDDSVKIWWICS